MFKKTLALILAACMACSSLTVFADEAQTPESAATPAPVVTEEPTPAPTEEPAEEPSAQPSAEPSEAPAQPEEETVEDKLEQEEVDEEYIDGNYKYTLYAQNNATITGYVTEPVGEVVLPSQVGGYPVRDIGKEAFQDWTTVTTTTSTSYTDKSVSAGTTYQYSVRAVNSSGKAGEYGYSASIVRLTAPTLSLSGSSSSIKLSWKAVTGATSYRLQRSVNGGSYTTVSSANVTSYTDSSVSSGNSYSYRIYAVNNSKTSVASSVVSYTILGAPSTPTGKNVAGGVSLIWEKVNGASGYYIYRKNVTDNGSYAKIATVGSSTVSYTDTNALAGKKCNYCIVAYNGSTTAWSTARSITYSTQPTVNKAYNTANGIYINWGGGSGATQYQVYRKASGESSYKLIATTGKVYTYEDTTASEGVKYYYCVVARANNISSAWSSAKSVTRLVAPVISNIKNTTENGSQITWSAVQGVTGYKVYRRLSSGGSYSYLASVGKTTSYTDTSAEYGTRYYYCIVSVNGSDTSTFSGARSALRIARPEVSLLNSGTTVKVQWEAASGATSYKVYRKVEGGSYEALNTVTTTTYTDATVEADTTYVYCVVAYNSGYQSAWSSAKSLTVRFP